MKEDSGLSSASKQLQQCTCGGGGGGEGGHHITPVDKGLSLHIPTLSPAHQHMHNMRADMVGIEGHAVFKVTSEYKLGTCSSYCVF